VRCILPVATAESLALAKVDGEPLLRRALASAVAAGLDPVVVTDERAAVLPALRDGELLFAVAELPSALPSSGPVLVHDPLSPFTPADFLQSMVVLAHRGVNAVAVLPVTDTVKLVDGDVVRTTIDRSAVTVIASPLVGPAHLVLEALDTVLELPELARRVGLGARLQLVPAPITCGRVTEPSELDLLAAVYELHQRASGR
jgi:2-C-methyl-D-erythritol 4-phosphate cytidylyltransferase